MPPKKYLTRKEVCSYLTEQGINVSISQLTKYVTNGGGPTYFKFGKKKVLYRPEDIDSWVQNNLSAPLNSSSNLLKNNFNYREVNYVSKL
jgi:hypothetical protein